MKFENWIALKFILENKKKIMFPFLAIVSATFIVFMSVAIKGSIEKTVVKDLRSMSKNTVLLGGDIIREKDINFINSIPDVDYYFYSDQLKKEDDILFKGYPKELLKKMKLPELRERDVILDKIQFSDKILGETIIFYVDKEPKEFLIRGFYEELNPIETMKVGKRVILSGDGFKNNIWSASYERVVVAFKENIDSNDYIPVILNNLNAGREKKIVLLETPEIFKKVNSIISFLNKTLLMLLFISLGVGGFFTFNMTANSIFERKSSIGILKTVGMEKNRIFKVFFLQNFYILMTGMLLGIILSIISLNIMEMVLKIAIYIDGLKIFGILVLTVALGVLLGIAPIKKIEKLSVVDLLRV
ncbi:ABC transporter permease [Cetobacterium somerae]|uniref:ABC transporter permease n=1 Tax=Cetobacterium somerae TaxID=188913 RepID=UPI00211DF7F6|nr:ABC transporter permease [Cetobacterium somerae]MCQ9628449.1 ABC transporter permease [Cetobacterium somerae]